MVIAKICNPCVCRCFQAEPKYSSELLPIYNYTSRQHYDDTSTPVSDWSQSGGLHGTPSSITRKFSTSSRQRRAKASARTAAADVTDTMPHDES